MNIYLIRHGEKTEDDKNHASLELTEKGFHQADLLGRRLTKYSIARIYSSDMTRAIQTAQTINQYLGVHIITNAGLREIRMGACDTMGWPYLVERYPEFMEEFSRHDADIPYPPDGECGRDVWQRAGQVIRDITMTGLDNVAVVTHGGVIRILLSGFLGLGQERRFYIGEPLMNCSISIIKYDERRQCFYVHSINDYAHLEDDQPTDGAGRQFK